MLVNYTRSGYLYTLKISTPPFFSFLVRVWMHGCFTLLCVLYENTQFVDDLLRTPSSTSSLIEEIGEAAEQKPPFPPSFFVHPLSGLCNLTPRLVSSFIQPHLSSTFVNIPEE